MEVFTIVNELMVNHTSQTIFGGLMEINSWVANGASPESPQNYSFVRMISKVAQRF